VPRTTENECCWPCCTSGIAGRIFINVDHYFDYRNLVIRNVEWKCYFYRSHNFRIWGSLFLAENAGICIRKYSKIRSIRNQFIGRSRQCLLCPSTCFSWGDIMIILSQRPCQPAHIDTYRSAVPGTSEATTYSTAQLAAGPQVIMATNIIPFLLIFAFLFLFIYMRLKKKRRIKASLSEVAAI